MKKLFVLTISLVMIFIMLIHIIPANAATERSCNVKVLLVGGYEVVFPDQQLFIQDSRTYVPLRFVSQALGGKVGWNNETQTATVDRAGVHIAMTIGSNEPMVDGMAKIIDVPAQLVNDRMMVPLRFVSEALGAKVKWEDYSKTVYITPASIAVAGKLLSANIIDSNTVYGTPNDVPGNEFRQGRYRYWGYTVKGELSNPAFLNNETNTGSVSVDDKLPSEEQLTAIQMEIFNKIINWAEFKKQMDLIHIKINKIVSWGNIDRFDEERWKTFINNESPLIKDDIKRLISLTNYEPLREDLQTTFKYIEYAEVNYDKQSLINAHRILHDLDIIVFNPKYNDNYWGVTRTIEKLLTSSPSKTMKLIGFYALGDSTTSSWTDLFEKPYPYTGKGNTDIVNELALGWYSLDKSGNILTQSRTGWQRPDSWEKVLREAKKYNLITEMVIHLTDGDGTVSNLLNNESSLTRAVSAIVKEAKPYQGVNLDFEGLGYLDEGTSLATTRENFTRFVRLLSGELKAANLNLTLTLHAPNSAYRGYDYQALGELADRIVIMAYDYGSKPEPVNLVLQAVEMAKAVVPPEKLLLGISVPSETPESILIKAGIAKRYNLSGIALWRLGLVSDEMWDALRSTVKAR